MTRKRYVFLGLLLLLHSGCQSPETSPKGPQSEETETTTASILHDTADSEYVNTTQTSRIEPDPLTSSPIKNDVNTMIASPEGMPIAENSMIEPQNDIFSTLFPKSNENTLVKVNIKFENATLADVIPAFATPLKFNYTLDPELTATVSINVDQPISLRDVWQLLERLVTFSGGYCELEDQVLHIRSRKKLAAESGVNREAGNIVIRNVPLKYVTALSVEGQLKKFSGNENSVTALESSNSLLLVESKTEVERMEALIEAIDRSPRTGWKQIVLPCKNVSSAMIAQELQRIMPILGFPVADGNSTEAKTTGAMSIYSIDRIQTIVASAATEDALLEMSKWVSSLDQSLSGEQEQVYLYEVVNSQAGELMQALSVIFPVQGNVMSASDSSAKSGAATIAGATQTVVKNADGSMTTTTSTAPMIQKSIFDTEIAVFADEKNNRLLLRTTPRAYSMASAIMQRLDTIPDRILLQVLVVEIELSNSNEFGVEFSSQFSAGNTESVIGTNYDSLSPGKSPGQTGGKYYIYNPDNPDQKFGYIRALAGSNKMKVLSSPQIVATSHSESKISVGKQVPVVTSDITDTASSVTDDTALRRSYQYKDTGIILTVTPRTTRGGLIAMDIEQVISEAVDNTTKGIDSPIIKQDELKTSLSLRSGRTLILGGLIKEKIVDNNTSVPLIADIPYLRSLAGSTTQSKERTEILILVTASIIQEDSELQIMLQRYRDAVKEIKTFESKQSAATTAPDEKE